MSAPDPAGGDASELLPPYRIRVEVHPDHWPIGVEVSLDSPTTDAICESFSIEVSGFVVRHKDSGLGRPKSLEFKAADSGLWVTQIDRPRPDVVSHKKFSGLVDPSDVNCGFNTVLPSFLSLHHTDIDILVVHEAGDDGRSLRFPLARITFLPEGPPREFVKSDAIRVVSINSMGRSGSSLVCRVLDAHPNCVAPKLGGQYGEVYILGHYLRAAAVLASDGAMARLNALDTLGDFETLPTGYLRTDESGDESAGAFHSRLMALTREHSVELVRDAHTEVGRYAKALKPEAKFWVEKSWNQTSANLSKKLIADWREVMLVRDIRSFWRSQALYQQKIGFTESQLAEHAHATYAKYVSLALAYRDRDEAVLLVRYEDLVADPETEFRRIMAHLGLPFSQTFERAMLKIVRGDDAHARAMSTKELDEDGPDFYEYLSTIDKPAVDYLKRLLADFGYSV